MAPLISDDGACHAPSVVSAESRLGHDEADILRLSVSLV